MGKVARTQRTYEKDQIILSEGTEGSGEIFYLIGGTAAVEVGGAVVGQIYAGEFFGEMASILQSKRTASVVALTPCECYVFKGIEDQNLFDTVSQDPKMMTKFIGQLVERLAELTRRHADEVGQLASRIERYRKSISGSVFALEQLSEQFKSKAIAEVLEHLKTTSGIATGEAADADRRHFTTTAKVIFG